MGSLQPRTRLPVTPSAQARPLPSPTIRAEPQAEAWVSFIRPLTVDTAAALLGACQSLMGEGVEHIHLAIGSGGGSIIAGLSAYNQLRALPLRFTTYNIGCVDSVAILPYLLGDTRHADPWSSFLFHGVTWTFAGGNDTAHSQVADAFACVSSYERHHRRPHRPAGTARAPVAGQQHHPVRGRGLGTGSGHRPWQLQHPPPGPLVAGLTTAAHGSPAGWPHWTKFLFCPTLPARTGRCAALVHGEDAEAKGGRRSHR